MRSMLPAILGQWRIFGSICCKSRSVTDIMDSVALYFSSRLDMSKPKIEIKSVVIKRALSWQAAVNQQIEKDISELKEMGESIYYSKNGKLICEHADGRKFEYRYLADGTQESLAEPFGKKIAEIID